MVVEEKILDKNHPHCKGCYRQNTIAEIGQKPFFLKTLNVTNYINLILLAS